METEGTIGPQPFMATSIDTIRLGSPGKISRYRKRISTFPASHSPHLTKGDGSIDGSIDSPTEKLRRAARMA
jgi:hypothetical protein